MVFQDVTATVSLPLPSSTEFSNDAFNLAWPQILAFSSAVLGILLVSLIIKAFSRGS